jgi:ribosome modulation factor
MLIGEITKDLPNSKYMKTKDAAFFNGKTKDDEFIRKLNGYSIYRDKDDNYLVIRDKDSKQVFKSDNKMRTAPLADAIDFIHEQTKDSVLSDLLEDVENFVGLNTEDRKSFSPEEAKAIGDTAGVDFTKIDLDQYRMGLETEQEHNDLTNGDPGMISKIVVAHLNEIPDYYTRLQKMESSAEVKDESQELKDLLVKKFDIQNTIRRNPDDAHASKQYAEILKKISEVKEKDQTKDGMAEERAFSKGSEAKKAGKKKSENPYSLPGQGSQKSAWNKGWEDAEYSSTKDQIIEIYKGYKIDKGADGHYTFRSSKLTPSGTWENGGNSLQEAKELIDKKTTTDGGEGSGKKGHQTLRQKLQEKMKGNKYNPDKNSKPNHGIIATGPGYQIYKRNSGTVQVIERGKVVFQGTEKEAKTFAGHPQGN